MRDEHPSWEEWTAIVGPWPDERSCLEALRGVFEAQGHQELPAHRRGCSIARIYQLGTSCWLSADSMLVARLAAELARPRIFGVEVEYGDSGNEAVGVQLFELVRRGEEALGKLSELGGEPEDRDALDAALDWERRLAARAVSAPEDEVRPRRVFYDGQG
ncbi:hypothetical protein HPC49_19415 [Pyxidicoccus fallax]|uniref:Uncharacterized protein n=1 Tax=Pyxidicoccus fallax TaxID=394095 RepID=A0A848L6K1_9BACT|nr:hypothetical protein [Pyxidicoccus fallax]NMO14226.1 hypothetical protein [Pyxidicoccus fallax]NPC80382.1 hypothetical protein [Pyxidicoccus fallax]